MTHWRIRNTTSSNGDCYYTGSHQHPRTLVEKSSKPYYDKDAADRALALGKRKFPDDWFWQHAEVYEVTP